MNLRDASDYKSRPLGRTDWGEPAPAKRYRVFLIAGGTFVAAYAIRQGFSLALLSATIVAGAQVMYYAWSRFNAKTRETEELGRIHFATAEALATAIDAKDQTTHCHVRRVQIYAAGMGEVLGLSRAEIAALKAGALLHDIGKLAVPAHIINKPGRLTPAEFDKMKIHTTVGAQILILSNSAGVNLPGFKMRFCAPTGV